MTTIDELTAEAMALRTDVARLTQEHATLVERCRALEEALGDAATSLETASKWVRAAHHDTEGDALRELRAWAFSRAKISRSALTPSIPGGGA